MDKNELNETVYKSKTTLNGEDVKLEQPKKSKPWFLYLVAFTADLLMFTAGTFLSWTSPLFPKLNGKEGAENNPLERPITPSEESWLLSLLPLVATFVPFIAGSFADKIGRKRFLLIMSGPMVISLVVSAFAKNIFSLYVAVVLMGLSVGGVFMVLPIYLNEIAESHNRGAIVGTMTISLQSGVLLSFLIGPFLSIRNFCLVRLIPLIVFVPVFAIWCPETPHFLAAQNSQKALDTCLTNLRKKPKHQIQEEAANIAKLVEKSGQTPGGIKNMFKTKSTRKAYVIVLVLVTLQQCSGVSVIFGYMQSFLDATKTGLRSDICALFAGIVPIFGTVISSMLVDRLGRKILFIISCLGSATGLFCLGLCFHLKNNNFDVTSIAWLPTTSIIIFAFLFNIGLRPIPWTVLAEVFPQHLKSTASTSGTITCFFVGFLVSYFFTPVTFVIGEAQSFWIFALVCFSGAVFAYVMLPETKGKSLQEIQLLLVKK